MDPKAIESLVREVLRNVNQASAAGSGSALTAQDYPLQEKRPALIKSRTGKGLEELTLEGVKKGEITFEDLRIHPDTLEYQAEIAEAAGRPSLAQNFRRAKELTAVPDEEILSIYNSLRPFRSSKQELLGYADRLEKTYNATTCAQLIREAAEVYEKRDMLA
jgi:propanediol dehydratase small subunit